MARNTQMHYDPSKGKWTKTVTSTKRNDDPKPKGGQSNKSNNTKALTDKNTNPNKAKGKAEKKSNQKVYYTLTAGLTTIANNQTLKIKTADTVKLKGFGKYLTGNYYVETKTIHVNSGGLSVDFNVLKSNFRKTIKKVKKKK